MFINEYVAIHTNKISLVPYCEHHVSKYHEWMQDPDIQVATASEPLTLQAEYDMQKSWREDSDKLTFILCLPQGEARHSQQEASTDTIGDVNLFVQANEEDSGNTSLVGEFELMIAEKQNQSRGMGSVALLVFMKYVLLHEPEILADYFRSHGDVPRRDRFDYFRVKINETNSRSIHVFESIGFRKTEAFPNFFGEFELRNDGLMVESLEQWMQEKDITGYVEVRYPHSTD